MDGLLAQRRRTTKRWKEKDSTIQEEWKMKKQKTPSTGSVLYIFIIILSVPSPDTVAVVVVAEFPSRRIKVSKVSQSKDAIMYLDV